MSDPITELLTSNGATADGGESWRTAAEYFLNIKTAALAASAQQRRQSASPQVVPEASVEKVAGLTRSLGRSARRAYRSSREYVGGAVDAAEAAERGPGLLSRAVERMGFRADGSPRSLVGAYGRSFLATPRQRLILQARADADSPRSKAILRVLRANPALNVTEHIDALANPTRAPGWWLERGRDAVAAKRMVSGSLANAKAAKDAENLRTAAKLVGGGAAVGGTAAILRRMASKKREDKE